MSRVASYRCPARANIRRALLCLAVLALFLGVSGAEGTAPFPACAALIIGGSLYISWPFLRWFFRRG